MSLYANTLWLTLSLLANLLASSAIGETPFIILKCKVHQGRRRRSRRRLICFLSLGRKTQLDVPMQRKVSCLFWPLWQVNSRLRSVVLVPLEHPFTMVSTMGGSPFGHLLPSHRRPSTLDLTLFQPNFNIDTFVPTH